MSNPIKTNGFLASANRIAFAFQSRRLVTTSSNFITLDPILVFLWKPQPQNETPINPRMMPFKPSIAT
jgi:hypothetical protein